MQNRFRAAGTTLLEVLVVMAIILLLVGLLLPVFAHGKERAVHTTDMADLQQIGLAYHLYEADYGAYPSSIHDLLAQHDLPDATLSSPRDKYTRGEASELTGNFRRRISYIGPCDYKSPADETPTCLATNEELLTLPVSGPLVMLLGEKDRITGAGYRGAPARYLRLTFAGGVVFRSSRRYRLGPGEVVQPGSWAEHPVARFYDEDDGPFYTFYRLRIGKER